MKFEAWLNAPIRINNACILKRKVWLTAFIKNGLYPFIVSKGYSWAITEDHLRNCIATGLYENMGVSCLASNWNYGFPNTETNEDHKSHFYYNISHDAWDTFWNVWGNVTDFHEDTRGQDRRFDVQEFIWGQLDLENSPQTKILNEMLEDHYENDVDDKNSSRIDIYLQEAQEY